MKNVFLFIILIALSLNISAQKKIEVSESSAKFNDGSHNAIKVTLYEVEAKFVEKAWKKKMKSYKAKVESKKIIFADNALIKEISENTLDIYAFTKETNDSDIELSIAINLGGVYLSSSSHPAKFKALKSIIYNFAVETTKDAIKDKIKAEEKILDAKHKEQKKLVKENEDLKKDIENYKEKIKKAEENVKSNTKNQEDKATEIEAQKLVLEKVNEKLKSVK